MSPDTPRLPATFNRLAWSNLAAQSAEQIALAAAPIVAVLLLGVGEGQTGFLQTALTLPFILFAIPPGLLADRISRRYLMAGAGPLRAAAPRRHPLQDIREGAVFVLHHPLLRPVFITQFIFNTASFLLLAVFVPYAVRRLGLSATGVGTTLAMYGVGMVVGALVATRVMRRLPFGTVIGLWPVTGFVAAAVMALTTLIPTPWLAALSFFLLGAGPILWGISTTTLRQSVTPPSLLGRVSAINIMSYGARPVGSALGAIVGGFYGAEACLYLAVAIFGAQALVILMSPAVSLARQPEMVGEPAKA